MSAIRGCTNDDCVMKHKKAKFKASDMFCSKCGTKLVYVCADCYEPVEKMTYKYCWPCQKRHDARKENRKEAVIKVAERVAPVVLPIVTKVDPKKAVKAAVKVVKR